jgi:hypothetical protein
MWRLCRLRASLFHIVTSPNSPHHGSSIDFLNTLHYSTSPFLFAAFFIHNLLVKPILSNNTPLILRFCNILTHSHIAAGPRLKTNTTLAYSPELSAPLSLPWLPQSTNSNPFRPYLLLFPLAIMRCETTTPAPPHHDRI